MTTKMIVATASAVSGIAILGCLISVVYIFNDINIFYDQVMEDMKEFQVVLIIYRHKHRSGCCQWRLA